MKEVQFELGTKYSAFVESIIVTIIIMNNNDYKIICNNNDYRYNDNMYH